MDRVERLGLNALPAALTDDMWAHVYVQQANSVFAGKTEPAPPAPPMGAAGLPEKAAAVVGPDAGRAALGGHHEEELATMPSHAHQLGTPRDEPSGEDKGSNFYGISHFPCCITNFPQGWPKLAAHAFALLPDARGVVVASLMPSTLTLPSSIVGAAHGAGGGESHTGKHTAVGAGITAGVTVSVGGAYPFDDSVPISVASPAPFTLAVRIPSWASSASVNGVAATPGTLHTIHGVGGPDGVKELLVRLVTAVQVERGWGPAGVPARADHGTDSADTAGGSPAGLGTQPLNAGSATASADGDAGRDSAQLWGISPGVLDPDSLLEVPQWRRLDEVPVRRSPTAPHAHPPPASRDRFKAPARAEMAEETLSWATPPTDGVAFTRGPLVFAMRPTEVVRVTKSYASAVDGQPNDLEIGTPDAWNYAVDLGTPPRFVHAPSEGWSLDNPFSTKQYPFYVEVCARRLRAWGYWQGTNITENLPPSPVNCSVDGACGAVTTLRLVPYGATNIRISVFPWFNSSAQTV